MNIIQKIVKLQDDTLLWYQKSSYVSENGNDITIDPDNGIYINGNLIGGNTDKTPNLEPDTISIDNGKKKIYMDADNGVTVSRYSDGLSTTIAPDSIEIGDSALTNPLLTMLNKINDPSTGNIKLDEANTISIGDQTLTYSMLKDIKEIEINTDDIAANTASINTLNTEVATNTKSIDTLNTEVSTNTASINTLNTEVAANTASIDTLNTSVAAVTAAVAVNTSSIDTLNTEVAANTASIDTLNTEVASNTVSISTNKESIDTLNTNVAANTASIDTLNTEVASNTKSIDTLNINVSANTSGINTLNTNVAANTASIDTLNTEVTTNTTNIATNTTSITTLYTNVATNTDNIATNKASITTLNANVSTLNSSLGDIDARLSAGVSTLTDSVSDLNDSVDTLTSRVTAVETSASNANTAAATAQTIGTAAQTAAAKAQTTADSANTAAAKAQTTADSASTAAATAQTSADSANTAATAAQTAATKAQTSADSANTTATAAQTAATKAQTTADSANTAAANASTAAATAQTAATKAQTTADSANTSVSSAQNSITELQSTTTSLDSRVTTLEKNESGEAVVLPFYAKTNNIDFGTGNTTVNSTSITVGGVGSISMASTGSVTIGTESATSSTITAANSLAAAASTVAADTQFPLFSDSSGTIGFSSTPITSMVNPSWVTTDGVSFSDSTSLKEGSFSLSGETLSASAIKILNSIASLNTSDFSSGIQFLSVSIEMVDTGSDTGSDSSSSGSSSSGSSSSGSSSSGSSSSGSSSSSGDSGTISPETGSSSTQTGTGTVDDGSSGSSSSSSGDSGTISPETGSSSTQTGTGTVDDGSSSSSSSSSGDSGTISGETSSTDTQTGSGTISDESSSSSTQTGTGTISDESSSSSTQTATGVVKSTRVSALKSTLKAVSVPTPVATFSISTLPSYIGTSSIVFGDYEIAESSALALKTLSNLQSTTTSTNLVTYDPTTSSYGYTAAPTFINVADSYIGNMGATSAATEAYLTKAGLGFGSSTPDTLESTQYGYDTMTIVDQTSGAKDQRLSIAITANGITLSNPLTPSIDNPATISLDRTKLSLLQRIASVDVISSQDPSSLSSKMMLIGDKISGEYGYASIPSVPSYLGTNSITIGNSTMNSYAFSVGNNISLTSTGINFVSGDTISAFTSSDCAVTNKLKSLIPSTMSSTSAFLIYDTSSYSFNYTKSIALTSGNITVSDSGSNAAYTQLTSNKLLFHQSGTSSSSDVWLQVDDLQLTSKLKSLKNRSASSPTQNTTTNYNNIEVPIIYNPASATFYYKSLSVINITSPSTDFTVFTSSGASALLGGISPPNGITSISTKRILLNEAQRILLNITNAKFNTWYGCVFSTTKNAVIDVRLVDVQSADTVVFSSCRYPSAPSSITGVTCFSFYNVFNSSQTNTSQLVLSVEMICNSISTIPSMSLSNS